MQTRFADLGILLYDFVGVMVILSALASFVALFNMYGKVQYDKLSHRMYFARRAFPSYPQRITMFWTFSWLSALLTLFLLGMLKDVNFGVEVIGYEAATIIALWILSVPAFRFFVQGRHY